MPRKKSREHTTIWTFLLHPAVWFMVATGLLIYVATSQWQQHRSHLLVDSHYAIDKSNIRVNPPAPDWLDRPLKSVVNELGNSQSSLLDPYIVPDTHDYLANLPWIRNVNLVEKSLQGIDIELQYRQPVAFVELDRHTAVPVDQDGKIFDRKLLNETQFRVMRQNLMRISLRRLNRRSNAIVPWQTWPDARVPLATQLCNYLQPVGKDLELFRVVSYDLPDPNSAPRLQVWTRDGTVVIWGSAPGIELAGEASAQEKILAIRKFVADNGPLSKFNRRNALDIDVTTGEIVLVKSTRVAEVEKFRKRLLK